MIITIIFLILISISSIAMLVVDICLALIGTTAKGLSAAVWIGFAISVAGWLITSYYLINCKRRKIFSKKISSLDRGNEKLENLFILLDFIEDRETDLNVVKSSLNGIYFSSNSMRKNPKKIKKQEFYNLLIEYYISLTMDKYEDSFFWDYNINFFTWRFVGVLTAIGTIGIGILLTCSYIFPKHNPVLFTGLYFIFGGLLVPFVARFFGHLIERS